jgi:heme-degrading monooxygenase HmoA
MMCVTTRFQLRRPWQMLGMYRSYRRMRRDLETAPGLLRHAFLIQSPTACCTLSVWASQEALDRFANVNSHIAAVRYAKSVCREIWSTYWRLDAISTYASSWEGSAAWPELVPHPEQPWRLVEPEVACEATRRQGEDLQEHRDENAAVAAAPASASNRPWDWHGARRVGADDETGEGES